MFPQAKPHIRQGAGWLVEDAEEGGVVMPVQGQPAWG